MEFRKIFDTIPEQFDRWRPRYCDEAFADVASFAALGAEKSALEIGPGTGQATEPILKTGCRYLAVELGEHLSAFMREKYKRYDNFHLVNDDFITHDFGRQTFDLIYSAAAIQWIPEEIAFSKTFGLLKNGGTLAMLLTQSDERSENEALYEKIDQAYTDYFQTDTPYNQKITYENAVNYGFTDFQRREYPSIRTLSADEYLSYIGTHCTHIALKEPYRSRFFDAIRKAIQEAGGQIVIRDTVVLYLARKP